MFTTQITPRLSETNMAGHIGNTVLPAWFEAGRAPIDRIFSDSGLFDTIPVALRSMQVTFDREIFLDADVTIQTAIARIGRTSFGITERAIQKGRVCATGEAVYVVVGAQGPTPIPDPIREQLAAHQAGALPDL